VDRLKKMFRISELLGFSRKNIFADISGHDDLKWAFDRALSSPDPIHILLKGLVGTGKTRFIKEKDTMIYLTLLLAAVLQALV
jgi:hypothetical protein